MQKLALTAGAFALALLVEPGWAATTLGMPTPGYVYFHQRGADIARHNEAVESCAIDAAKAMSPVLSGSAPAPASLGAVLGGVIGGMLLGGMQDDISHANFTANVENCMVASGWEVVRLDGKEGKALSILDHAAQAEALTPWVGAEEVHGVIARRYESVALTEYITAGFGQSARDSLSLASDVKVIMDRASLLPPSPEKPNGWDDRLTQILPADPAKIPEGAAVIVLRGVTPKPPNSWVELIYLGEKGDGPQERATYLRLVLPNRTIFSSGTKETTLAFAVPAGHWAIAAISTVGFCLRTSGFTVSGGEAVFAGSFNSQALFTPDFSMEPVKAALGDSWVARNLKTAAYHNGEHFRCESFPQQLMYGLDIAAQ